MMIDSNILIYSLTDTSPKQKTAQLFLHSQKQIVFAQQNIFESIRILTHSKFPESFSSENIVNAMSILTSQFKIIHPNKVTQEIAFELIKKYKTTGTEIFDTYLIATALSNGIKTIATDNVKHLGKYEEIEVVNPF